MNHSNGATHPKMSALDCEIWQDFIAQRCSLHFSQSRLEFLRRRLWERMRQCRISTYNDYYHYVAFNPAGEAEWQALLALLLDHETSFFRHQPSFDALTDYVLPQLIRQTEKQGLTETMRAAKQPADKRHPLEIAIWSAGCSTGQEPYSLAIAFLEQADLLKAGWQVKVLGSDIGHKVLEKARRGLYKPHELRNMPDNYRQKYMTLEHPSKAVLPLNPKSKIQNLKSARGTQTLYQITNQVRSLVQFTHLNLNDPDSYPPPSPYFNPKSEIQNPKSARGQDIIFCQNVLIYFKPAERIDIVQRLCQRLNPGGYLFLAPAEVVGLKLPNMKPVRLTEALVYQRNPVY